MHHWPLLLFTLALQISAGGFLALALLALRQEKSTWKECAYLAACAVFGTLCSMAHLGDMFGAYRALANVGSSWLSREVWLVSIFTILALLSAYQAKRKIVSKGLLWVTACFGLLGVFASCAVYATTSMPQWTLFAQFPYLAFFASTLLLGPSLVFLLRTQATTIVTLLIALGAVLLLLSASYVPPSSFSFLRFLIAGLGIVGMVFGIYKRPDSLAPASLILVAVGEGMGRYLFFAE